MLSCSELLWILCTLAVPLFNPFPAPSARFKPTTFSPAGTLTVAGRLYS